MDLDHLLLQIDDSAIPCHERAWLHCDLAKELAEAGNYKDAQEAKRSLRQQLGERPQVEGLDKQTAAEVLLRAGVLSGWIGSTRQIDDAQELAKNLISESIGIFEALQDTKKVAEARIDLAYCYWREGALDEARGTLRNALAQLTDKDDYHKTIALLRSALIEKESNRYTDALRILNEAAPLVEGSRDDALKGKFHNELAQVLEILSTAERRDDYRDLALIEYSAASFHFEQSKHVRYHACVENNLALLFFNIAKFPEAHQHLDHAHRLFASLGDSVHMAQVDDSRAKVMLAEGRNTEAEKLVRGALQVLEKSGQPQVLVEALTTHGRALAHLGRYRQARAALERALAVAQRAGDFERAGLAALTVIEELGDRLKFGKLCEAYVEADKLLSGSQDMRILKRMNVCAGWILRMIAGCPALLSSPAGKRATEPVAPVEESRAIEEPNAGTRDEGWAQFCLRDDVRRYEARVIERALREAGGVVSRASQLLGFRHHNSLIALLNTRHKNLLHARSPIIPRKRSIIRETQNPSRSNKTSKATKEVIILYVEDNRMIAQMVKERLEAERWKVVVCVEGTTALKVIESNVHYDLLLVDNELPGVGGLELVRQARRLPHRASMPIAVLSASDCVMEAHRAGANVFLRKPEDIPTLVQIIGHLLKLSSEQGS